MRWHEWKWQKAICLIAAGVWTQIGAAQGNLSGFEQMLKGQSLPLRSYSADKISNFTWTNGKLAHLPSELNTLGVFTTQSVDMRNGGLTIHGVRATVVRDGNTKTLGTMGSYPMVLNIDLHGAAPEAVLPQLKNALFFASVDEAIRNLPASVTPYIPYTVVGSRPEGSNALEVFDGGKWHQVRTGMFGVVEARPSIIRTEPVHMVWETDIAKLRATKVPDTVGLVFFVSKDGTAGYVWLAKPDDPRLDKNALDVLGQAKFTPALDGDHYVGMEMALEFAASGSSPGHQLPRSCHETGILTYNCGYADTLRVSPSTLVWNDLQREPMPAFGVPQR